MIKLRSIRLNRVQIIALTLLLFFVVFIKVISQYGIVTFSSGSEKGVTYTVLNQNTNKTMSFVAKGNSTTRIVRSGTLEITANTTTKSSWSLAKSSVFLIPKSVGINLKSENSREFIGNNPYGCVAYTNGLMASYDCGATFNNLKIHKPATDKIPTITTNSANTYGSEDAIIIGFIKIKNAPYVLLRNSYNSKYTISTVSGEFNLSNSIFMGDLDPNLEYKVVQYKGGILVYDTNFDAGYYYADVVSAPQKIAFKKPSDPKQKIYKLVANGDTYATLASTITSGDITTNEKNFKKIKGEVVYSSNGKSTAYPVDRFYSEVVLCGTSKICLLQPINNAKKQVFVYEIGVDKLKELFVVNSVQSIGSLGSKLVTVKDDSTLNIDVDNVSGSEDFKSNNYSFCGLYSGVESYQICLVDRTTKQNSVIDVSSVPDEKYKIDSFVTEVEKLQNIKTVSTYKDIIFISIDPGKLIYDDVSRQYFPNKAVGDAVKTNVSKTVNSTGLDNNRYKIYYTGF